MNVKVLPDEDEAALLMVTLPPEGAPMVVPLATPVPLTVKPLSTFVVLARLSVVLPLTV